MLDYKKLDAGLAELSGLDYEEAESKVRAVGDMTPDISFSKKFQARLAAKALGMKPEEFRALPIQEYAEATTTVSNFLLENLAMRKIQSMSTEK